MTQNEMNREKQVKRQKRPQLEFSQNGITATQMNSMKLVIPLHSLYWSIHTKDESKCGTTFAFIFGVN